MRARINDKIYWIISWLVVPKSKWFWEKQEYDVIIYCRDDKYNSIVFNAKEIQRYE